MGVAFNILVTGRPTSGVEEGGRALRFWRSETLFRLGSARGTRAHNQAPDSLGLDDGVHEVALGHEKVNTECNESRDRGEAPGRYWLTPGGCVIVSINSIPKDGKRLAPPDHFIQANLHHGFGFWVSETEGNYSITAMRQSSFAKPRIQNRCTYPESENRPRRMIESFMVYSSLFTEALSCGYNTNHNDNIDLCSSRRRSLAEGSFLRAGQIRFPPPSTSRVGHTLDVSNMFARGPPQFKGQPGDIWRPCPDCGHVLDAGRTMCTECKSTLR